jgi:hypothetical protein
MAATADKKSYWAPNAPAGDAFAITPHDTNPLTTPVRAVYIGGAGDVNLITLAGNTVLFAGALAGTWLPIRCSHVLSTDTTATNLVGMY